MHESERRVLDDEAQLNAAMIEVVEDQERDACDRTEREHARERCFRIFARIAEDDAELRYMDRVARHEASHCYIHMRQGSQITAVGLRFSDDPPRCQGGYVRYRVREDERSEEHAGTTLAGIAGDRLAGVPFRHREVRGDWAKARECFGFGPSAEPRMEAEIRRQQEVLRPAWPAIEALARELTIKLVLSGPEAAQIITRALSARAA